MRKFLALAALGLALPVAAQAQTARFSPMAHAENAFAVDLYGKLDQTPGNLFFSPYSIATALDMTYAGAKGATADEMARMLHLNLLNDSKPGSDLRQALLDAGNSELRQPIPPNGGFTLETANALWGDKGFAFDPGFILDIQSSFGGTLKRVNFKRPEHAAKVINRWVANQTQNKIQNLVSADMLLGDPAMVLTNAVYFKSRWAENFDQAETKPATFHISAAQDVTADMMNMRDEFSLTQADGVKVLSIPYDGYATSMVIILPDDAQGLAAVEAQLTAAQLNKWLADAVAVPVILSVPKFQMDGQFKLKPVLQSLGMNTAFDAGHADFRGIAENPVRPLYIGEVLHKAYIGMDEKGTEAAAATAVVEATAAGVMTIVAPPPIPVRFNADHPFLYLIRSENTGEILFMGRVDDPTQGGD